MAFKPVGADTVTSLFPTRVMTALATVFAAKGDLGSQKIVRLTKAAYAALTRDANTLYVMSDWTTTTLGAVDSFNRIDSTSSLGTTDIGALLWSALNGSTWGISGNKAYSPSNTAGALAVVESGSANHTAQVTMSTLDTGTSLVVRCTDSANLIAIVCASNGGNTISVYRNVAGAISSVSVTGNLNFLQGDAIKCVMSGSTGTIYRNGIQVATFSDSTTGTKSGIRADTSAGRLDDYTLAV